MAADRDERAERIHNEQVKLRATILNTVAAGFAVAGIITPVTAASAAGTGMASAASLLMILGFLLAAGLHHAGVLTLETIR